MAKELSEKVIDYRRHFHMFPELGWTEYATAAFISEELERLGFCVKKGKEVMSGDNLLGLPSETANQQAWSRAVAIFGEEKLLPFKNNCTALAGIKECGDGPVVVCRFDMDALPINESHDLDHFPAYNNFASKNNGVMHSCGHDAHMAIGLGLANLISEGKSDFKGTIILLFQPAEEGVRGADAIIRSGFLDNVDYILASHVWSNMPLGTIVCSQDGTAATHKLDAVFKGKSCHAGICPEIGNDALIAAANAVLNLHAISRNSNGFSRINVGRIEGGTGRNIVPDYSKLEIELRGENTDVEDFLWGRCNQVLNASAVMNNCELVVNKMGEAKGAVGDLMLAKKIFNAAEKNGMFSNIILSDSVCRGSEDFASMMNHVQTYGGKACFIGLGASFQEKTLLHHTPDFDIDEKVLINSVKLFFNIFSEIC